MKNEYAFYIWQARKRAGLSQQEVAHKLGISRQAMSNYEKGKRNVSINLIVKMADIYETGIEDLIKGSRAI